MPQFPAPAEPATIEAEPVPLRDAYRVCEDIARAHYGEGFRYTTIFEANKEQIRDPNLIYPGQTFTLPKVN